MDFGARYTWLWIGVLPHNRVGFEELPVLSVFQSPEYVSQGNGSLTQCEGRGRDWLFTALSGIYSLVSA